MAVTWGRALSFTLVTIRHLCTFTVHSGRNYFDHMVYDPSFYFSRLLSRALDKLSAVDPLFPTATSMGCSVNLSSADIKGNKSTYRTQQDAAFSVTKFLEDCSSILTTKKKKKKKSKVKKKKKELKRSKTKRYEIGSALFTPETRH